MGRKLHRSFREDTKKPSGTPEGPKSIIIKGLFHLQGGLGAEGGGTAVVHIPTAIAAGRQGRTVAIRALDKGYDIHIVQIIIRRNNRVEVEGLHAASLRTFEEVARIVRQAHPGDPAVIEVRNHGRAVLLAADTLCDMMCCASSFFGGTPVEMVEDGMSASKSPTFETKSKRKSTFTFTYEEY